MSTRTVPPYRLKPDPDGNPTGTEKVVARQREKEKHLLSLRIDHRTVILVPPERCNAEYAAEFLKTKMQP